MKVSKLKTIASDLRVTLKDFNPELKKITPFPAAYKYGYRF